MTNAPATPDPLLEEFTYPTLFGEAEVFCMETDEGEAVRVLYVGGGFQSASYLGERRFEPVFEYYRAFDHLFEADPTIDRILMIGGGAYSYPKHLLTTNSEAHIDVVEIDPTIIDIARTHFYVDELEQCYGEAGEGRLRSFAEDGVAFLESCPDASYQVVINDSFDGTNPTGLLMDAASLANAKRALVPGGLYLLNAVVDEDSPEDVVETAMDALVQVFDNVYEIPAIDEEFGGADNYLIIATDGNYIFSDVTSMLSRAF